MDVLTALRTTADDPDRPYYSVSQAAARLGVSRVTIWRWIRAGDLPVRRLGHRTVRIRSQDLDAILAAPAARPADIATAADSPELVPLQHVVQFYESDEFLLRQVAEFIGSALTAGDVGILIATEDHR